MDSNINESLNVLRIELISQYLSEIDPSRFREGIRSELLKKIETIVLDVIKAISKEKDPYFLSIHFGKCDDKVLPLGEGVCFKKKKISFARRNSRQRFAVIIFLLSKVYKLLASDKTSTKRELYYQNLDIFKSQTDVELGMRDICYMLNTPSWELGVLSTAKGIVAGPLVFKSKDSIINCDKPGGVLIPHNILEVELLSTSIKWALIIEKDAAFQNILDGNGLSKLKECLFITGKGFPDLNTRLLVCRLWECFKIPILILVDADPYGLEIMCVYRFGSMKSCNFSQHLACPSVRWIGVHPSDIKNLAADYTGLSERDTRKLSHLIKRSYIKENEKIRKEVQFLIDENIKAEIEGISGISSNYITDVYIPSKIRCKEYF